jgi:hypothetical protein
VEGIPTAPVLPLCNCLPQNGFSHSQKKADLDPCSGTADAKTLLQEGKTMTTAAAAAILEAQPVRESERHVTLLELVSAVGEITSDDEEVTETVLNLLRSDRARLCGNFKDMPIECFES